MRMRSVLKIGLIIGILLVALSATTYAASVTSVTGSDGTNTFAATADEVTAYTPLESTLTVSGTVDTAEANVTIMISAEDTVVYVNQTVADAEGAFAFEFPVTLENGYTYEIKVNTENSDTASTLYFKTEEQMKYGDMDGSGSLNGIDVTYLASAVARKSVPTAVSDNLAWYFNN